MTEGKSEFPHRLITEFAIPFGAILIATIALLATSAQLSRWAIVASVSYLVIVAVAVLVNPLSRLLSFIRVRRRKKAAAKSLQPLVQNASKTWSRVLGDNSDTIVYLLKEINSWPEVSGNPIQVDMEHVTTLRYGLESVQNQLDVCGYRQLPNLSRDLSFLITQYHRLCQNVQKQLETLVSAEKLFPERRLRLRQEWNLRRENHNLFINEWKNLAKDLNQRVCENTKCFDYYELLRSIESRA